MARFTSAFKFFDAVTASVAGTTADIYEVAARKNMSIEFAAFTQNAVFEIQISNDGTNFVTYNRLTANATNTNSQTDAGVGSVTAAAGVPVIYFIRNGDHFRYIRGSVAVVGGGSATASFSGID